VPIADGEWLILCWASEPHQQQQDVEGKDQQASCTVQKRSLLQLCALHGSLRCASLLLARGANPLKPSGDGLTAYDVSRG